MDTVITLKDVFLYLEVTAVLLLIAVLYNFLFIVVDLRKVMKRIEVITKEVQNIILKPINLADHVLEGISKYMEEQSNNSGKDAKKAKKNK